MEQKALDIIISKMEPVFTEQEFTKKEQINDDTSMSVVFEGESIAYSIYYDTDKKRFELRTTPKIEEDSATEWKSLSIWLFNSQDNSLGELDSITGDFLETVQGPKRVSALKQTKKKRKKSDEENTPEPPFFFNRLGTIIPELREDVKQERVHYGEMRAVTFARTIALPRLETFIASSDSESASLEKLCQVFNDMYEIGDMNLRSIITIVILNNLSASSLEKMKPFFNEALKRACKEGLKYKGKTVKPEKKKKKSRLYNAETLNEMKVRK